MLTDYSAANCENSVAVALSAPLLAAGYLLYWHDIDVLQTPDAWYHGYRAAQATYHADPALAARLASARGLLTVLPEKFAVPRWITRPTSSGILAGQDEVPVPALTIGIGDLDTGAAYQLGDRSLHWRSRTLTIEVLARDRTEQRWFSDHLVAWLGTGAVIPLHDHESGSLARIDLLDVDDATPDSYESADEAEATTYEVLFTATLCFVA